MKTLQTRLSPHGHLPQHGFALVVSITLMVLLTTLAIGLLSLAAIELRTTSRHDAMLRAQSNARLALFIAIGELQKEMGPDRRISAPGGQLLEEGDRSGRKHWTGVYESWPEGEEMRPAPVFRRWLVSADEAVRADRNAPANGSRIAAESAILVAGNSENDPVEAGLVSVEKGSFAWWVADENTKANIGGPVDPSADVDESLARMQSSPRAAHEMILGDGFTRGAPELYRIASVRTVDFLGASPTPLIHDITTASTGLLTNVRSGGMKRDLSFYLEKPSRDVDKRPLYTAGSKGGINFYELWRDFNIWGEIVYPSNPPRHQDGKAMPPGVPTLVQLENPIEAASDPFLYYRSIKKVQTTLIFSLLAERRMVDGRPDYLLYLVVDPVYTIWNPLNVPIHLPRNCFAAFKTWAPPYNLRLNLRGGPGGDKVFDRSVREIMVTNNNDSNFMVAEIGRLEPVTMRPGEVQLQSQGFNQPIRDLGGRKSYVDNKIGWDFGSGYRYLIPYETDPAKRDGSHRITYSMLRNANTSNQYGLFISGYFLGRPDQQPPVARPVGGHNVNFRPGGVGPQVLATSHPKIFPNIPEDMSATRTIGQLANGDKWPISVFSLGLRTENDPDFDAISAPDQPGTRSTGRFLQRASPKTLSLDMFDLRDDLVRASPLQVGMRRLNSLGALGVECDHAGLGYYGGSYTAREGVSYLVTHHVPTKPIHSLGALQHSLADTNVPGTSREATTLLLPTISQPIANSFAPSVMPSTSIRSTLGGRDAVDHSYLVNLALWDDWFFSSISPQTVPAYKNRSTAHNEQKARLEAFLAGREKLPNARFIAAAVDPEQALKEVFSGANSRPVPDAHLRSATYLMVDGAFNVNSVSVPAWRAMLAGLKGEEVPVRETPSTPAMPVAVTSAGGTPVPGLLIPSGMEIPPRSLDDPKSPEQWTGFRSLTDEQIDELATAIVKQVRLRGPFVSLADFVNRHPGRDKELSLSGALQSALDDPSVSINEGFRRHGRSLPLAATAGFEFPEAEAGAKTPGAPGYVKQGDLLTSLAPLITVRGDTFLIRAYGESRDEAGVVNARIWCEATVRRMPEYLDRSDEAHTATPAATANKWFGRRLEVVSFRWLSPNEI